MAPANSSSSVSVAGPIYGMSVRAVEDAFAASVAADKVDVEGKSAPEVFFSVAFSSHPVRDDAATRGAENLPVGLQLVWWPATLLISWWQGWLYWSGILLTAAGAFAIFGHYAAFSWRPKWSYPPSIVKRKEEEDRKKDGRAIPPLEVFASEAGLVVLLILLALVVLFVLFLPLVLLALTILTAGTGWRALRVAHVDWAGGKGRLERALGRVIARGGIPGETWDDHYGSARLKELVRNCRRRLEGFFRALVLFIFVSDAFAVAVLGMFLAPHQFLVQATWVLGLGDIAVLVWMVSELASTWALRSRALRESSLIPW